MVENQSESAKGTNKPEDLANLGDEILKMLSQRTPNPSEAFVLLQRLSILLWYQYNIDWHDQEGMKVAPDRKQRYLDFVSDLIDILTSENEQK